MLKLLLRSLGLWLLLIPVAIANAGIREKLLVPLLGEGLALPASGLLLSLLILALTLVLLPLFRGACAAHYLLVGGLWLALTLAFELVMGRVVMGRSWGEVAQVFNLRQGNLMLLVLLTTALAPYLAARLRGRL
ncbi:hypothetical protein DESUT3_13000 [Desulfuromonas versatilis]|uniref:Uncharacterized protein n=1 Tax=Desulfuromonas versatilis TaxID=2802975 RepID=A0ABM8HUR4_9BACT|nr:hypothetical protein [Desulfuromonas versatilis]BCR04231.1 hypothetical protein DESUT3_13000 [Desulfuromonas versatilis]